MQKKVLYNQKKEEKMTDVQILEIFKHKFFDSPSRAFGETYVQELLYKILGDKKYQGNNFDALRGDKRGEYKAVRVVFDETEGDTIFDKVMDFKHMSQRIGTIADIRSGAINSNFQNIKLDIEGRFDFDYLVYVLVDNDGFHIFETTGQKMTDDVRNNKFPNWCARHGSKEGEQNGQFPVKQDNLDWHIKNNYIKTISWSEILDLSKDIKPKSKKNSKAKN